MKRSTRGAWLCLIATAVAACSGCLFDAGTDVVAGIVEGDLPPYIVGGQFDALALDWLTPLEFWGTPHVNVVQKTRQGQTIFGWFLPVDDPAGTVLIHHGAVTNRSAVLTNAAFLKHFGYNVLVYDYQGFGESESEVDLATILADADAALVWLQECDLDGTDRIVLYGVSLGTLPTIAQAAAGPADVVGMIVEGSFTEESLPTFSYLLIGLLPWAVDVYALYPELDPLQYIGEITMPKLFIQSRNDTITPFTGAEQLYEQATPPKQFEEVYGEHTMSWFADLRYSEIMRAFLGSL